MANADSLFQKHGIEELRGILDKIKSEANKKKFDLRRLVGDSYKDVIEAADAIGNMKQTVEILLSKLEQNRSFSEADSQENLEINDDSKVSLHATAAKIKFLLITPEQIWNAIESSMFLNATRMFIISRLLFTNLQQSDQSIQLKFPIIKDLWENIGPLKTQIIEKASLVLRSPSITSTLACECIFSIGILKNATVKEMFYNFLDQRKECLMDILKQTDSNHNVSECMVSFLNCLEETLTQVINLFATNQIQEFFESQTFENGISPSAFAKIFTESSNVGILFRYLPQSIKFFSLNLQPSAPLMPESVYESGDQWLVNMSESVYKRLGIMLSSLETGNSLAAVKARYDDYFRKKANSENKFKYFRIMASDKSLWNEFFERAFLEQTKSIIQNSFNGLFLEAHSIIESNMKGIVNPTEKNVALYMWSQKFDGSISITATNSALMMTPLFLTLEKMFSTIINKTIEYIKPLLSLQSSGDVTASMKTALSNCWATYCGLFRNLLLKIENDAEIDLQLKQDYSLFLGRSLMTFIRQLTNLQGLLSVNESLPFDDLYYDSHKLWITQISQKIGALVAKGLSSTNWISGNSFTNTWEQSGSLKYPSHPSIFISAALFHVCEDINRIDGFSMQQSCVNSCLDSILIEVGKSYRDFLGSDATLKQISENGAIQLYFDFAFFQSTLGHADTFLDRKGVLLGSREALKSVAETIKNLLKPDVLASLDLALSPSVSRAGVRSLVLFNLLFPLKSDTAMKPISDKNHMVIALAPSCPRIALLPVAVPMLGVPSTTSPRGSAATRTTPVHSKLKTRAKLRLRPDKKTASSVPSVNTNKPGLSDPSSSSGRVQGLMNAVAGLTQQPKVTSELLASASSFFSGLGLSSSTSQSPGSPRPPQRMQ